MKDKINIDLSIQQLSLLINSVVFTTQRLSDAGSDANELEPYKELEYELRSAILAEITRNDQKLNLY